MNPLPLVSIIIPTYNQQPVFLQECIDSALNQTYRNFEVILSDNFSTEPKVKQVLDSYYNDERVIIVRPEKHVSMIENFVFASSRANGEYLSFLSSDDVIEPDCLELLMELILSNPDITFAFGNIEFIESVTKKHISYQRSDSFRAGFYTTKQFINFYIYLQDAVWMNGDIIRKDKFDEIGGIESPGIIYSHDYALTFRLLAAGATAGYVNKPLGKVRIWNNDVIEKKTVRINLLSEVNDLIENYNIILGSGFLLSLIDGGKQKLITIRNRMLETKAEYVAICYIKGDLEDAAFLKVKQMLQDNIKSFKILGYFTACKTPFKQILLHIIKVKDYFKLSRK